MCGFLTKSMVSGSQAWNKKSAASKAFGLPFYGEQQIMDFLKKGNVSGAQPEMGKNAASQAPSLPLVCEAKTYGFIYDNQGLTSTG